MLKWVMLPSPKWEKFQIQKTQLYRHKNAWSDWMENCCLPPTENQNQSQSQVDLKGCCCILEVNAMNKEKSDSELTLLKVTQKFPSNSFLQEISSFSFIFITYIKYKTNGSHLRKRKYNTTGWSYHCHQALSTFIKYLLAHLLLYSQAFLYTIEDDTTSEFKWKKCKIHYRL